jgi:hypothetical protein
MAEQHGIQADLPAGKMNMQQSTRRPFLTRRRRPRVLAQQRPQYPGMLGPLGLAIGLMLIWMLLSTG